MLGITGFEAKYIKQYAQLRDTIRDAVEHYVDDVKEGRYPTEEHGY
jgi:3-methyl-2-oxobutanoate hydroxymethyltransferase